MMKKQFKKIAAFIAVGILIVCAVFICACTESEVDPLPPEPPPEQQPTQTEYAEGELVIIEDGTTKIENSIFWRNNKIRKVVMPDSVIEIDDYAFYGCDNLEEIVFSENLETVGDYCFTLCTNLKTVTLPLKVSLIGRYAFALCKSLISIDLPSSVEIIGNGAFVYCTSLNTLKLPENARIDGLSLLYGSSITTLTLPIRCSLYREMFENCNKLCQVILPKYIPCFEKNAFKDSPLERLYYRGSKEDWKKLDIDVIQCSFGTACVKFYSEERQDYLYDYWYFGEKGHPTEIGSIDGLSKYCTKDGTLIIPDGAVNISISSIPDIKNIRKIIMPDSVTFIDSNCFMCLSNLTEVTLSKNLREIPYGLFRSCTSLKEITIPDSVTKIEDRAFSECTSLTEITLPDSVTEIGYAAFEGCTNLTNINFPAGLKKIDRNAFTNSGLTRVVLPDSVESIDGPTHNTGFLTSPDYGTFAYCENLTELILPANVVLRNTDIFEGCTSLKKLTLPNNTRITYNVFQNLESLEEISFPYICDLYETDAFKNCPLKKVYYRGSRTDWKEHGKEDICGKNGAPDILFYSEAHPGVRLNEYWHYVDGVPAMWS